MTTMPLRGRLFRGGEEGPRLLVTAGVHGDEYTPMAAVRRLIARFDAGEGGAVLRRGTLILVPVVNETAFCNGARCAREDGLDLARVCPGRARGTVTERTACALARMIREADLYIDLHSGGAHYRIEPLAGYMLVADKAVLETQRAMARDFGLPLVWGTDASLPGRSLSTARDSGVPAIYVEYLGGPGLSEAGVEACATGVLRVLAAQGMLVGDGGFGKPEAPRVVEDPRPSSGHLQVRHASPCDGFFEARVALGDEVEVGDLLGEVVDFLGTDRRPVVAEHAGRVLMLRTTPWVREGESLGVVLEEPPTPSSASSAKSASSPAGRGSSQAVKKKRSQTGRRGA